MKLCTESLKRPKSLEEVFSDDPFGLLDNLGAKRQSLSVSEKVKLIFEEIAEFVKENQRLPSVDSDDFDEELLAEKYNTLIKEAPEGKTYCESFLENNATPTKSENLSRGISSEKVTIIPEEVSSHIDDMKSKVFNSIDDVFSDDPLGLLSAVGDEPIEIESWNNNGDSYIERSKSGDNQIAKQKECEDFYRFEKYFTEINSLLSEGHLTYKSIKGDATIELGDIFVINGLMSIIADIYSDTRRKVESSRKIQYRVRQIFANKKESNPYSTSIKTNFYSSDMPCSRLVPNDSVGSQFLLKMNKELVSIRNGNTNAISSGFIYILASQSKEPCLQSLIEKGSLVKIGFSHGEVAKRIANAQKESTYLCAPVTVLKTYECFNFDARNLEDVLHTILADFNLKVNLKDSDGNIYHPREWFTINVNTASEIIEHIFARDLNLYYLDKIQGKLKLKK